MKLGSTEISKMYLGSTEVTKAYLGSTLVHDSSPSPVLPYDAEVEYLQSSGTQYIDSGIPYNSSIVVECKVKRIDTTTDGTICGIYYKSSGDIVNRWTLYMGTNSRVLPMFGTVTNKYYTMNASAFYTLNATYRYFTINGSRKDTSASQFSTESKSVNIYLFARHDVTQTDDSVVSNGKLLMSYLKIWNNNVLVRDYIPVRVGQVGYLYDNVSGELFGNDGTGSFTLGNDVTT